MNRSDSTRIPDILVEQYVLGELSPEEVTRLETNPELAMRVAEIERSNEEILSIYSPEQLVVRIQNQAASGKSQKPARARVRGRSFRWVAWAIPVVAGAAVALTIGVQALTGSVAPLQDNLEDVVRIKGDSNVLIYRSSGLSDTPAEQLEDGAKAHEGDRLQLAYNSSGAPYGAIVSVDGRGMVTLHFPLTASAEPELIVGHREELQYAYQLDDAPNFERFFFVTSEETFSVESLLQALRAQAAAIVARPERDLQLESGFAVTDVTLIKGE